MRPYRERVRARARAQAARQPVKVFWLYETSDVRVSLRRYRSVECPSGKSYCDASVVIVERAPASEWGVTYDDGSYRSLSDLILPFDPRWPLACAACGTPFVEDDPRQVNPSHLYSGSPDQRTQQLFTLRDAPAGAMWDAEWMPDWYKGADGICLMVRLPNGSDWCVDSEASNCTAPAREKRDDGRTYLTERTHYCWCRHGDPRTGEIHVDKNCTTCQAGAGSIQSGNWHGFLHNGYLTQ